MAPLLATSDRPLLIAVSGGTDSLALLMLAHASLGSRVHAATVDHKLRAESADEARGVASVCAARGIAHRVLTGPMDARVGGSANVSQRARTLRYRLLAEHAAALRGAAILTGHHADDQVETLVMRLNRASGLGGLAGVRAANGDVVRPLLGWTRAELIDVTRACGLRPVDDPTNRDDAYDRARLRKRLAEVALFDAKAVAASMAALAEADAALDAIAMAQCAAARRGDAFEIDVTAMPIDLVRRVALKAVMTLDDAAIPRRRSIVRLGRLVPGETAMLGDVVITCASISGTIVYRVERAPPRRGLPA